MCVTAFHGGQRWRVRECEVTMWPSVMWAETSVSDERKRVRKQVMKERCEEEGCMHAYENTSCKLTLALAGSGGRECAVACGWDPPVSVLACPPSPHTSRLFILHCGKITAPAVSSGPCKVYIACPEVHVYSTILPNSPRHKERRQTGILALYVSIIELI